MNPDLGGAMPGRADDLGVSAADIDLAINEQLFASLRLPLLMVLLSSLVSTVLLWTQGGRHSLLLLLLAGLGAIGFGAHQLLQRFQAADSDERRHGRWRRYLILLASLSGGSMALAASWLLPLASPLQQALCIGLLTAASVLSGSSHAICPRVHLAFTLSSLLPLSISLLEQQSPWLQQWGLFSLILLLTQLLGGWMMQRVHHQTLLGELRNRALLTQQQHNRRMSDALNQELAREIFERQSVEQELLAAKWQLESQVRERQRALTASEQALRRETDSRLYLTHHDQLTGLTNRSLLLQRLEDAATRLHLRSDGSSMALLLIDLDRFKWINESLGHAVADDVLRQTAQRLHRSLSSSDTLARIAVDEFAILLEQAPPRAALEDLATHLLAALRQPLQLGEHELRLSASIGIALYPGHGSDARELIGHANHAVCQVKQLGGNRFAFFQEEQQGSSHERLLLEAQLDKALELGQLVVHYQPRLNLASDHIDAVEALVRWHHPELGLVSPASFIGLAEETGQISAIGLQVLRQACQDAR